ncbi:type II secretion system protein [Phragmitibacter flavus]|nr:prepilin-type N-terminal cleavage/methylation domain-containing protein [Phragmitibacter flavus]
MRSPNRKGVTLVEILMVVTLIGVLVTLAIPSYSWLRERAGFAGCVSRMRILHIGFTTYMQENDMIWPQLPQGPGTKFADESAEWEFWYNKLKDHGVDRTQWICPSDQFANSGSKEDEKDKYKSSYVPTAFDEFPNTAFRWKQPWVIERGGFHYKDQGANLLMPDGTITQGPAIPSGL